MFSGGVVEIVIVYCIFMCFFIFLIILYFGEGYFIITVKGLCYFVLKYRRGNFRFFMIFFCVVIVISNVLNGRVFFSLGF